jgi:hypothetical protein
MRVTRSVAQWLTVSVDAVPLKRGQIVGIGLRRVLQTEYSTGSGFVVELSLSDPSSYSDDFVKRMAASPSFSAEKTFEHSMAYRYVVLTFSGEVIAVERVA